MTTNETEDTINIVWQRIIANQGQPFFQIRGKEFTYTVTGNTIHLNTTNQNISRAMVARAAILLLAVSGMRDNKEQEIIPAVEVKSPEKCT